MIFNYIKNFNIYLVSLLCFSLSFAAYADDKAAWEVPDSTFSLTRAHVEIEKSLQKTGDPKDQYESGMMYLAKTNELVKVLKKIKNHYLGMGGFKKAKVLFYTLMFYKKAQIRLSQSASHNYAPAMYERAMIYIENTISAQASKKAFKLLQDAAMQDHKKAQYQIYFDQKHQTKEQAFTWLEQSAKQGFDQAQVELFKHYYAQRKNTQAAGWLLKAADEQNYPVAQWTLGVLYLHNNKLDDARIYLKMAMREHPLAKYDLARSALLQKDHEDAIYWLEDLMNDTKYQNHPSSAYLLSQLYKTYLLDTKNIKDIENLFNIALSGGVSQATYGVANTYLKNKKYDMYISWLKKAAKQGHYQALLDLNLWLLAAESQKSSQAFKRVKFAAKMGSSIAKKISQMSDPKEISGVAQNYFKNKSKELETPNIQAPTSFECAQLFK